VEASAYWAGGVVSIDGVVIIVPVSVVVVIVVSVPIVSVVVVIVVPVSSTTAGASVVVSVVVVVSSRFVQPASVVTAKRTARPRVQDFFIFLISFM
jgi:hypothetical protein